MVEEEEEEALYRSPSPHPEGGSSRRGSFVFAPLALRHLSFGFKRACAVENHPRRGSIAASASVSPPVATPPTPPLRRVSSRAPPLY